MRVEREVLSDLGIEPGFLIWRLRTATASLVSVG